MYYNTSQLTVYTFTFRDKVGNEGFSPFLLQNNLLWSLQEIQVNNYFHKDMKTTIPA